MRDSSVTAAGGEDAANSPSSRSSGQSAAEPAAVPGALIRDLRCALGWSQGRLADELRTVAGHPTVTREDVSRWENGKRSPGPFWLRHLATALQVPLHELEREIVRRREMLKLAGMLTIAAGLGSAEQTAGAELYGAIATGDSGPLATVQTSHQIDLMLATLMGADRPAVLRVARWMEDGGSDVLRVNSAGILAKSRDLGIAGQAAAALRRDEQMRMRYLKAVRARAGDTVQALSAELGNPRDAGRAGARRCCWAATAALRPDGH